MTKLIYYYCNKIFSGFFHNSVSNHRKWISSWWIFQPVKNYKKFSRYADNRCISPTKSFNFLPKIISISRRTANQPIDIYIHGSIVKLSSNKRPNESVPYRWLNGWISRGLNARESPLYFLSLTVFILNSTRLYSYISVWFVKYDGWDT